MRFMNAQAVPGKLSRNAVSLERELFLTKSKVLELSKPQSAAQLQAQQLAEDRQKMTADLKTTEPIQSSGFFLGA